MSTVRSHCCRDIVVEIEYISNWSLSWLGNMLRTELPLVGQVNAGESNKLHVLPKMPDVRKNKTMCKVSNTDRLAICKTCRKLAS